MRQEGITLVELLVVMSVVGILILVTGFEFKGWIARYKMESQIKELHSDLRATRTRAKTRKRPYLIGLSGNGYEVCEDDNDNDVCDAGEKFVRFSKDRLRYTQQWAFGNNVNRVKINRKGIVTTLGSIWALNAEGNVANIGEVDYDCVTVSRTRILMGKLTTDGSKKCVYK